MGRKIFQWNDYNISYYDEGSGDAVILIHAFPLNARMWEPQIKELRDQFRIITVDLPGFGDSRPTPDLLTMELGADLINALLEHLNMEVATIGGLSMGGYVTMAFARKYPRKLGKMILADTRASADTDEARVKREEVAQQVLQEGTIPFVENMLNVILGATTLKKKPEVVNLVKEIMLEANPKAIAAAQRGMALRSDSFDVLEELRIPTLIIVGEEDTVTPKSDAESMQNALKNAALFTIGKAGHLSNLEAPSQFNLALESFLTSDKK